MRKLRTLNSCFERFTQQISTVSTEKSRLFSTRGILLNTSSRRGDWKSVLQIQVGDTETRTDAQIEDAASLVRPPVKVRVVHRLAAGLLWLSTRTRGDLAYGTCGVASHCARPETSLMIGKRLLRYAAGSLDLGLRVVATDDVGLEAYGDAPFDPIVSQTGFAILCLWLARG